MKKCIFLFAFMIFLVPVVSGEGIVWDYYLRNREFAVMKEKVNILPNTLRMNLTRGEYGSLHADVTPNAKLCEKLSWRLVRNTGAVEIYPSGETCTVYGSAEGEETVEIALDGKKSVKVDISVTEPREIQIRSFELEKEPEDKSYFTSSLVSWLARGFFIASLAILFAVGILMWKKRRGD